jgi:hypothetical protein
MFHAKAENLTAAGKNFTASRKKISASRKCFTAWHNPLVSPVGATLGATFLEKMCTDFQIVKFQV